MLAAAWSGARGWLTPPVLFVFVNLVIGTIAVMSWLMSSSAAGEGGDQRQRSLMRAPSVAFDRLRCFSFSRLCLPADHHAAAQYSAFDDDASSPVHPAPEGSEWRRVNHLRRAPSAALDRLRSLSFSRRADPSSLPEPAAEAGMEREQVGIERTQSEAAAEAPARRRPRARRTRMSGRGERADGHGVTAAEAGGAVRRELPPPAVEVDARADDFIRQFREQLRLQRLDSILRYKDTLRRTGTV